MTQDQNNHRDANSIIQLIIGCITAILFLSSSFHEFSLKEQYVKSLKEELWQKKDLKITPNIEFKFVHFRTGETSFRIEVDHQEFYENTCSGSLKHICKYIENNEIKVTLLNFYIHSLDQDRQIILLNTITFMDKNGDQQVFPNMPYAPNSPIFIADKMKEFRSIFVFAFLKHLFFALFFVAHTSTIYTFKEPTEKRIRYFIVIVFSLSFLSLVIRYFFI